MHKPLGDLDRLKAAIEADWGFSEPAGRPVSVPAGPGAPAQGRVEGHGRHPPGRGNRPAEPDRALAGPAQRGLRHRLRHRLDDDRHASGVAAVRPRDRVGRHVEPADPLRRRPDEPGLLRDDEPGRPRSHDEGRARGDRRTDRPGLRGPAFRPHDVLDAVFVGNPDHAPPVSRHRPDRTGRRALCAGRVRCRCTAWADDLELATNRGAGSMSCPASPAMSAPMPPPRRSPRPAPPGRHHADGRCRHQCGNRARQQGAGCRGFLADRPGLRGRRDIVGQRAAPGAIERVRIDPRTLEPKFRVIGSNSGPTKPGFAASVECDRHHRHLRFGHHRGRSPRCFSPASSPKMAWSTARWRRNRRASSPTGRTFSYVLHDGENAHHRHPERCARHPACQGCALRRHQGF